MTIKNNNKKQQNQTTFPFDRCNHGHRYCLAFYAKYNDAQTSVREDHISYFAGSDDDALMRMNIFFDEN